MSRGIRGKLYSLLTSAVDGLEWSTPCPWHFTLEKKCGTHWTGSWLGSKAGPYGFGEEVQDDKQLLNTMPGMEVDKISFSLLRHYSSKQLSSFGCMWDKSDSHCDFPCADLDVKDWESTLPTLPRAGPSFAETSYIAWSKLEWPVAISILLTLLSSLLWTRNKEKSWSARSVIWICVLVSVPRSPIQN